MWSDPIFVISMKDQSTRRASAEAQLAGHGLKASFIDAVEGRKLAPDYVERVYDNAGRMKRADKPLGPGELGCYLSHWMIFEKMVAEDIPRALILEDDFVATDGLPRVLDRLSREDLPPYDIIKLAIGEVGRSKPFYPVARLADGIALVRHLNVSNSTVAYVITKAGAARFLGYGMPIRYPIDVALNRTWRHGLNVLAVRPWPVLHDLGAVSTIGQERFKREARPAGRFAQRLQRRLRKGYDSLAKRIAGLALASRDAPFRRRALAEGAIARSDR